MYRKEQFILSCDKNKTSGKYLSENGIEAY